MVNRGYSKVSETLALSTKIVGAGDGDRTRISSLEGWSSTIELHPRVPDETRTSLSDGSCVEPLLPRAPTVTGEGMARVGRAFTATPNLHELSDGDIL